VFSALTILTSGIRAEEAADWKSRSLEEAAFEISVLERLRLRLLCSRVA
jgi:hypothetical protein